GAELAGDSPGRVGDDERPGAEGGEHPHREGDLLRGVPFIQMDPSLHDRDPLSLEAPQHQPALVARRGRHRKARDLRIRDRRVHLGGVGQGPQPAPEDDPQVRRQRGPAPDRRGRLVDLRAIAPPAITLARKPVPAAGAEVPRAWATVAPRSANVDRTPRSTPGRTRGPATSSGTYSRVWSVLGVVGSFP